MLPRNALHLRGNSFWRSRIVLLALLLFTSVIYLPGLNGPFLFDDVPNIVQPLKAWLAGNIGWQEFVFGNNSGLLGRSLSTVTFLINGAISGLDPLPFKLVNLGIHLLCGCLVVVIVEQLLSRDEKTKGWSKSAALTVGALWLVHPMQVSTVLYVVQRMAQLSALFALFSIFLFIKGRTLLEAGNTRKSGLFLFMLIPLATLAATFSKENGALVPLLCAAVELGYFRPAAQMQRPKQAKIFFFLFLVVPASLATIWYAVHLQALLQSYSGRLFSLQDRLLSEPRAIANYICALVFPRSSSLGLYTDDFAISRSLLEPLTTIAAIVFLGALAAASYFFRKENAAFFTGIAFYLCGHAIESTIFPLELYFEHRNYLPSVGFFLACAGIFIALIRWAESKGMEPRKIALAPVLLIITLGATTASRAWVWSSRLAIAEQGMRHHPASLRAQLDYATILLNKGELEKTEQVIDQLANSSNPAARNVYATYKVLLQCLGRQETNPTAVERIALISGQKLQLSDMLSFEMLARLIRQRPCKSLSALDLAAILVNIADSAPQPPQLLQIWRTRYVASGLYIDQGQLKDARAQLLAAWVPGTADLAVGVDLAKVDYAMGARAAAIKTLKDVEPRIPRWDSRSREIVHQTMQSFLQKPPRPK